MGKASNWLREERRKVLGQWVAVCVDCGHGARWFEEFESEVADVCPSCGGKLLRRCPACQEPFSSMFAIECEVCAAPLRAPTQFGMAIRKPDRAKKPASTDDAG